MPRPKLNDEDLRERWLKMQVKDCHEFGWPTANTQNVISDQVFSLAFVKTLQEGRQIAKTKHDTQALRVIEGLIKDIEAKHGKRQ